MEDETLSPAPIPWRRPDRPEQPDPAAISPAGDLTSSAYLRITTFGPTTVEARGTVPAGQTHMLLMSVTSMAGIMGAVVTAYIAAVHVPARDLGWFLGLAVAEMALAFAVILRIARRGHRKQNRKAPALPGQRPLPPELPVGNPREQ